MNKERSRLKRIGILRGGMGENYQSSLQKGGIIIAFILDNLANKYQPVDILIDKDNMWHFNGIPIKPADLVHKVDVIWNTAHPTFSNILDSLSIPNVGDSSFHSLLINNREMLRNHIKKLGIIMPRYIVSPKSAREVFEKFGAPWVVKNSNDVKVVKTFNELAQTINGTNNILVEELIMGKVGSIHSVSGFRSDEIYTFPFGKFASSFSGDEKEKLATFAKNLHKHIGARHYLKSDFVLSPTRGSCLLSIESIPDLRPNSHFHEACEAAGVKTSDIIQHILEMELGS